MWIAAGGDLHFAPATKVAAMRAELRAAASAADVVLLAGDLTASGRPCRTRYGIPAGGRTPVRTG